MKKLFATLVLTVAMCVPSAAQQPACDPGNTTGPPCPSSGSTSSTSVSTVTTTIILAVLLRL